MLGSLGMDEEAPSLPDAIVSGEKPSLDAFSDLELARELDRRAAASVVKMLFFGVWPGTKAGHYVRDEHGTQVWDVMRQHPKRPGGLYPWDNRGDYRREKTEGVLWHWHSDVKFGPTLLMAWDRSEDRRGGCCSTFILDRLLTPAKAEELARAAFPRVFLRIETHLGRSIVAGGAL